MKTVWIAIFPRAKQVQSDAVFEVTPRSLELQFRGGLTSGEIIGFFESKEKAEHAYEVLDLALDSVHGSEK